MKLILTLLMALMQSSTDRSASPAEPRDESAQASSTIVPIDELRDRVASGEYVPIPDHLLKDVLRTTNEASGPEQIFRRPQIQEAQYTATLNGTRLESGTLQLILYPDFEAADAQTANSGPLLIGSTSLQQLTISDRSGPIQLGSDASQRLFLLKQGLPGQLTGKWTADGLVAGDTVTFRLELPAATTSRINLLTAPQIQITSAGSLVLGPLPMGAGEAVKWTVIPGDASRLIFTCRSRPVLKSQAPLPLTSFSANHSVSADVLTSRWVIGLAAESGLKAVLTARIAKGVRISNIVLDDKRPVEWSFQEENGVQILRMAMPESSAATTLTVTAVSVLPQADSWSLPMLAPLQWQSEDGLQRGPILMPISQINVQLPAAIDLDEWILVGIQERDVVTGPDQSREYQLTQFLPDAAATVRTSTNQSRISDAVITLVEPAGRLATVRCMVNVRCEGSAVVELNWPVTAGWQVIAARYASNSRSLFFEFPDPKPDATTIPLTIHLPESLEYGASRVFEIQLQQADAADPASLSLPLQPGPQTERTQSLVMFPPAFSLTSDLQKRWSTGRKALSMDEIRRQMPWFPEWRLKPTMRAFESGTTESATPPAGPIGAEIETDTVRLEHVVRIADGLIVETSRIVLPTFLATEQPLSIYVHSDAGADLRWTLDGDPISPKREEVADSKSEWRKWTVPVATRRNGVPGALRCESRRAVSPEFIAAIPVVDTDLPVRGTLQLFSSDEGLLSVIGDLIPESPTAGVAVPFDPASPSTSWQLPNGLTAIHVRDEQNPRIQSGQTIDIQMLHLIGEHDGGLQREVLAVANVSRSAGRDALPLSLPENIRPLVLVNGHRVQLQQAEDGFLIPLPSSSADCQIVLTWSEPADQPDKVTGERRLPRLFLRELAVPQCTHHLLIDPMLELRAPSTLFSASEPTDIFHILDRLLVNHETADGTTYSGVLQSKSVPVEVRRFVTRWQLASVQNWQPRTLIDAVASAVPIVIEVTQLRRRMAIAAGTFLVFVATCIGLRHLVSKHRIPVAMVSFGLLGISFFAPTIVISATLRGAFWGLSVGLLLVMISRWHWLKQFKRRSILRFSAGTVGLLFFLNAPSGLAAQQPKTVQSVTAAVATQGEPTSARSENNADVLVPNAPIPGSDVVYVRRRLVDAWKKSNSFRKTLDPPAVVTSLHSRIIAESEDSIELLLTLGVAAVSRSENTSLRIPLQGSRLVECLVDGQKVLPQPDELDSILVPIPGSTLLPSKTLEGPHVNRASNADDSTSVDAGPLAAFTMHRIECRLRPVTSHQASGVQFRLPGLPCPMATLEVNAPAGLFSSARAQTAAGVVRWNPSDGIIPLNSLAMSDGIDVSFFQTGMEKGNPQLATVNMLIINETLSEQQFVTGVCRFAGWNQLAPEVRYRIPQNYELVSVSATATADVVTDLLWSVTEQNAIVQLPRGVQNDFVLTLRLKCIKPITILEQQLPIVELQRFSDCVAAPALLVAVRANPVFSVLPLQGDKVTTVPFHDLQSDWGQWLRRTDSIFRVPGGNQQCIVRLTPRNSFNEVRSSQEVCVFNDQIDWKCRVDVETSVELPVFRHRMNVSSDIVVTDVQVVAGEANRLASWHRRGDELVIQLKEGTTGQHGISITGRQMIRPDDSLLTLRCPFLQNAKISEPTMSIVDQDGLGLTFVKLGGAVASSPVKTGDVLIPGVPVRMQIQNESDPVVLQRIRPVEPVGAIAAIRSTDQVTFVMQVAQWSGRPGPLHLSFADSAEFLTEPIVLAEGRQLSLIREANEFVASQDVAKSLFNQSEFRVIWTMSVNEDQKRAQSASFSWPEIFEGIRWDQLLLVPLDAAPGSAEETSGATTLPQWLTDSALAAGKDLTAMKARSLNLPVLSSLVNKQLIIPVRPAPDRPTAETSRALFALSDTVVWINPNQSAVGETSFIIFAAVTPSKCSLRIPMGTVVTEIDSSEPTRWENAAREQMVVELTTPVTIVNARWMGERSEGSLLSTQLSLTPPFPVDCETRRTLTVAASGPLQPQFAGSVDVLTPRDLTTMQTAGIDAGLNHATPSSSNASGEVFDPPPSSGSLLQTLSDARTEFLNSFGPGVTSRNTTSCRPPNSDEVAVTLGRMPKWSTVASLSIGLFVMLIAAFARNSRAIDPEPTQTTTSALNSAEPANRSLSQPRNSAQLRAASHSNPKPTDSGISAANAPEPALIPKPADRAPSSVNGSFPDQ